MCGVSFPRTHCNVVKWCDVGGNVRFLAEQKAVVDVVNIIKQHEENAVVLQAAYALILSLLLQGWCDQVKTSLALVTSRDSKRWHCFHRVCLCVCVCVCVWFCRHAL